MTSVNIMGRFQTIECAELDQFSKTMGWKAEYHLLGKGDYSAWVE